MLENLNNPQPLNIGAEQGPPPEAQAEAQEALATFEDNLCTHLQDIELNAIATKVITGFDADKASRDSWEQLLTRGLDLLGIKLDETSEPFQGACTVTHPLIIENCVKFAAKAIQELFPPGGPVKTQIIGVSDEPTEAQAGRVKDYMNYQLTEEMPEYFDEMEHLLFHLAFAGVAFKKCYFDHFEQRPVSEFCRSDEIVVSNYAADLKRAERITHVLYKSKTKLLQDMQSGLYREIDLGTPAVLERSTYSTKLDATQGVNQNESPNLTPTYLLLEQQCYLASDNLGDDKGNPLPYIVTVDKGTSKVLSIYRNWKPDDPNCKKVERIIKYSFVPSDTFYSYGFVHLIGNLTKTATAAMRALIDAGQFANLQGGFKLKGLKIVGSNDPLSPGEWRDVEIPSSAKIADAVFPLPYKEPSAGLMSLLQFTVAAGQKFADETDQVVADSSNYGPVGTTMALLDASAKFFSSIHKRLHKAQRDELRVLSAINYRHLPDEMIYNSGSSTRKIMREDFSGKVDVIPVSDPNISSQTQRAAMAQALVMSAQGAPQIHNVREAYKNAYITLGIPNIDKILPPPPQPQPSDPLTDLMSALQGMPIKAFPGQDHDAHIAVKSAWLQDPQNGANPINEKLSPAIQANVQEHMIAKYTEQIQGLMKMQIEELVQKNPEALQQLQQAAPQIQQKMMEQVQGKVMIDAAKKVLQANQQNEMSPEMAKLALQKEELDYSKIKDAAEITTRNRELDIREKDAQLRAAVEGIQLVEKTRGEEKDRAMEAVKHLADISLKKGDQDLKREDIEAKKQIARQRKVASPSKKR